MDHLINILHLEDDAADAELVQATLELAGLTCRITRVQTRDEFSQAMGRGGQDVILADYSLPTYDGVLALRLALEQCPAVPFVFVSGTMGEDAAIEALTEGATDYVLKQKLSRLAPAVRRALSEAEDRRERRRAEVALRESEERFRAVAESAHDGIVSTDSHGTIVYWNRAAREMFGYADEEIFGQPLSVLMPGRFEEQYRDRLRDQAAQHEQGQIGQVVEASARRKDGREFPVEVSFGSWQTHEGMFFTGMVRDITGRKRAEEEIRLRNKELRALNVIAASVGQSLDLDQVLNTALDKVLQLDMFEASPKGMIFLLDELSGQLAPAAWRGVAQDFPCLVQPPQVGECLCGLAVQRNSLIVADAVQDDRRTRRPPGPAVRGDVCLPLRAPDKTLGVLQLSLPIGREVMASDAKLLQAICDQISLAVENARLYKEAQRYALELAALNQASQALASTLNPDAVLARAMDKVCRMLNASGASVLLRDAEHDAFVFAAAAGANAEMLRGAHVPISEGIAGWVAREGQPALVRDAHADPHFYDRIDAATGLTTHSLLAVPLVVNGVVQGVIEAIRQTDRAFDRHDLDMLQALAGPAAIALENARLYQAEREQFRRLQESQAQLIQAEKMTALGRLAATLAHEINNPLQAITSQLELAIEFPLEPDERTSRLKIAYQEIERLSDITRRVLNFARPTPAPRKWVFIPDLLRQALALASKKLQHSHIEATTELAQAPQVWAAPDQLTQVFVNLLLNAVEAIGDHGRIRITLGIEGEHEVVRFANDGPPIPAQDLPRVFEPFFTTKENGTGLGLAVSHNLIVQHGGTLSAENLADNKGVVFIVRLPLAKNADERH